MSRIPLEDRARSAGQTFREPELDAIVELLTVLRRGGDVRVLLRSAELRNVEAKFRRMLLKVAPKKDSRRSSDAE